MIYITHSDFAIRALSAFVSSYNLGGSLVQLIYVYIRRLYRNNVVKTANLLAICFSHFTISGFFPYFFPLIRSLVLLCTFQQHPFHSCDTPCECCTGTFDSRKRPIHTQFAFVRKFNVKNDQRRLSISNIRYVNF